MEQKSGQNPQRQKTTVNRFILSFLIGLTSTIPLWLVSFIVGAWWLIGLLPLVVFAVLVVLFIREKRVSRVKPRLLELFLAATGAFYPFVLISIALWLVWWVLYSLAVLFGVEGEQSGAAYSFATTVFGLLSLGFVIFLVRMNWRRLLNQLYPQAGNQSAFAQISATGKIWLLKRGVTLSIVFFVLLIIYLMVIGIVASSSPVAADFQLGLFLVIIYMFFISISAWLWLREPEIPRGITVANEAIGGLLRSSGYEVKTITEIKNDRGLAVDISAAMTASVDLIAYREDRSVVIDIMTSEETDASPDWVVASEFRTAVWYLKDVLSLPSPVEAVAVLVDVIPDDSFLLFAKDRNVKEIQLSGKEVVDLIRPNLIEPAMQNKFISLFSPQTVVSENGSATEPFLENGGRNG